MSEHSIDQPSLPSPSSSSQLDSTIRTITVQAPVNIAVIKYWGKKDDDLIIPLNDSVSGTLSMEHLATTTSVAFSHTFTANRMWLNESEIELNARLVKCLDAVQQLAGLDRWPKGQFVHICSRNNFPTAAGLASSAAGYAALVYSLCKLFSIHDNIEQMSVLARLGSGSACRSVYGGFVRWIAGHSMETSIARQIVDEAAWPHVRVLILVVSDQQKDTPSSDGMKLSARTSGLLEYRVQNIVPARTLAMIEAISRRDFHQFAEITMKDSNQFHAICHDTYPPIRYMNDVSWSVVDLIHRVNKLHRTNVAAYTFDAGPNACLYCLADFVPELLTLIRLMYSNPTEQPLEVKGIQYPQVDQSALDSFLVKYTKDFARQGALKYVISTKIGTGPQILTTEFDQHSLLDSSGLPKLVFN